MYLIGSLSLINRIPFFRTGFIIKIVGSNKNAQFVSFHTLPDGLRIATVFEAEGLIGGAEISQSSYSTPDKSLQTG